MRPIDYIGEARNTSTPRSTTIHICSFESRRAEEMRSLIQRRGAQATVAPSMRELPLDDNPAVFEFAGELFAGRIDMTVFFTGVGARAMLESLETRYERSRIVKAMDATTIVVRGPKPVVVLREWGIRIDHRAAEPNTWRELLTIVDGLDSLAGKTVAIQEYGRPNAEFETELRNRGAITLPVPVYRWALPDDTGPLEDAVRGTIAADFDVLMFTSARQVDHVLHVAESLKRKDDWLNAARKCLIASIGPTNSEALSAAGLPADVEASPPKMGRLVRQTIDAAAELLAAKRRGERDERA